MNSNYCEKCAMKDNISNIDIFNIINNIINSSTTYEIYNKLHNLKLPFEKWLEYNNEGYTVFHWYAWFISTNLKKNNHLKPKVYTFFQIVFSDIGLKSIFTQKQIMQIINIGTCFDKKHTLLYHLVRYCENSNDNYYGRLYKLLINNRAVKLTEEQLNEIKTINTVEEFLPDNLKVYINEITKKYKSIEELLIEKITTNYVDYKFHKCAKCNEIINFIKEIPLIIEYAKKNNHIFLLKIIWFAYFQRKLLNKLFDKYYQMTNNNHDLNKIHNRHSHILDIYTNNLTS
jgi:hypothetical protein